MWRRGQEGHEVYQNIRSQKIFEKMKGNVMFYKCFIVH